MNKERLKALQAWLADPKHRSRVDTERGVVLSQDGKRPIGTISGNGYLQVSLAGRNYGVHAVIAVAAGLDIAGLEVNHIDGDKHHNAIANLEPVTHGGNVRHACATGLMPHPTGEQHWAAKLTWADVRAIRAAYAAGGVTLATLAARYGVSQMTLSDVVRGRHWRERIERSDAPRAA